MGEWTELIQNVGLPVALVVFFVWNTFQREQRLEVRITSLEDFQKTVLVDTVKANTDSNRNNTAALLQLQQAVRDLDQSVDRLHERIVN